MENINKWKKVEGKIGISLIIYLCVWYFYVCNNNKKVFVENWTWPWRWYWCRWWWWWMYSKSTGSFVVSFSFFTSFFPCFSSKKFLQPFLSSELTARMLQGQKKKKKKKKMKDSIWAFFSVIWRCYYYMWWDQLKKQQERFCTN